MLLRLLPLCVLPEPLRWERAGDTLELFADYLRVSEAFASPVTYWWAIVEESRQRRCDFRLDHDWAKRVTVGLERGLPPQEQASPSLCPSCVAWGRSCPPKLASTLC